MGRNPNSIRPRWLHPITQQRRGRDLSGPMRGLISFPLHLDFVIPVVTWYHGIAVYSASREALLDDGLISDNLHKCFQYKTIRPLLRVFLHGHRPHDANAHSSSHWEKALRER